jgi:alanyl-tRNA synthetase
MVLDTRELKRLYIKFFEEQGHKTIPNSSLVPENDPSVLFTTAGMHPLVPFLLGQRHPLGKRLVNVQKCLRTGDIDQVGDDFHLTFFEMLGNWSLGDYFKEDSIKWSFEFLTDRKWLGLDEKRLSVTVFAGDEDAPRDDVSVRIWENLGIPKERIFYLPKKDNWWGLASGTGPCGPDTEIFYDSGKKPCSIDCKPGCPCGKYFEIWNNVFMEYKRTSEGRYELLSQKNVDTGMGVERTVAVLGGKGSVYGIEVFKPIVDKIRELAKKERTTEKQEKSVRIIADHVRSSVFILGDERGVVPSNLDQGYILRRLIRRAIRHGRLLGIEQDFFVDLASIVIDLHAQDYPELLNKKEFILTELRNEEQRFKNALTKGLRKFEEIAERTKRIDGRNAFLLFQSFGFPIEMTRELGEEKGVSVDEEGFEQEFQKHQQISRVGAKKKFKGGLSDTSEQTVKMHTATHLLNEALRRVLKDEGIIQKGSNITQERLRFDFNFDGKLTEQELKDVEAMVNDQIGRALPVRRREMTVKEAKALGAQAAFEQKYGERVSVYSIGDFSVEICGGPHVSNTIEVGRFKIVKEESVAAGTRRIKAVLVSDAGSS